MDNHRKAPKDKKTIERRSEDPIEDYKWLLECIDDIDEATRFPGSAHEMVKAVVETVRHIYKCDQAWLMRPLAPRGGQWELAAKSAGAQYPLPEKLHNIALTAPGQVPLLDKALNNGGQVFTNPHFDWRFLADDAPGYPANSIMLTTLNPQAGSPWFFGVTQCDHARQWTNQDEELFKRIARRITDSLSNKLYLEQLQANELSLHQLSEAGWEAIAVHDNGKLLLANDLFFQMFGYEPEEIIGKQILEMATTPDSSRKITRFIQDKKVGPYQAVGRRKDGSTFPIETRVRLMQYQGKEVRVAAIRDMSERLKAEEAKRQSEERYRLLFEESNFLVSVYDDKGVCLMMNSKVAALFGGAPSDFEGKNFSELHPEAGGEYLERIKYTINTGIPKDYEDNAVFPSGSRWLLSTINPVKDSQGKIYAAQITSHDITDRKLAEEALNESRERLRVLFEHAADAIYVVGPDGGFLDVNQKAVDATGFSKEELLGMNVGDIDTTFDSQERFQEFVKEITPGTFLRVESRNRRRDGSSYPAEITVSSMEAPGGPFYLGISRDITRRKRAEAALNHSEGTLRAILQSLPIGVSVIEGRVLKFSNPALSDIMGYSKQEFLNMETKKLYLSQRDYEQAGDFLYQKPNGGESPSIETKWLKKDGSLADVRIQISPLDVEGWEPGTVVGMVLDITEQKKAEQALKESEEQFRLLTEESPLGVALIDPEGNYLYINPKFSELFGYALEEVPNGREWFRKAFPDKKARHAVVADWMDDLQKTSAGEVIPRIYTITCKDGSKKIIQFRHVTTTAGQQFILYEDITERTLIENSLAESEQRYRQLFEESPVPLFMQDFSEAKKIMEDLASSGISDLKRHLEDNKEILINILKKIKLVFVNQATEKVYEIDNGANQAETMHDIVLPDSYEHLVEQLVCFYNGQTQYEGAGLNRTAKGNVIDILVKKVVVPGHEDDLSMVLASIVDMTKEKAAQKEKEKLELQLRQSQKMEAVGILAGGIAHDFNNILSAIMGYGELAQLGAKDKRNIAPFLSQIVKSAERARDLVKQLLTFSRRSEIELRPSDLNRLVAQGVKILRHTLPKMLDIKVKLGKNLDYINADATQIEQVIVNLAGNANDAMPEGGSLIFETGNIYLDEEFASQHLDLQPGEYVLLTVTDTGSGMDKQTLSQIFDPFFTTKGIGKGTGLGLSTVYGIVKEHGGRITCYSEPGLGATFRIYLPAIEQEGNTASGKAALAAEIPNGGSEAILLVDDEQTIRDFGARLLEEAGYRVTTASSGEQALEIYEEIKGSIDMIILDLGMPGMGGHRCLRELVGQDPEVKVLIASGYSASGKVADTLGKGASGYIAKPFRRSDLLEAVRGVLDA